MARRRAAVTVGLLDPVNDTPGDPPDRDPVPDELAPKSPLPGQERPQLDDEDLNDDGMTPEERIEIENAQDEADAEAQAKREAAEDAAAATKAAQAQSDDDADAAAAAVEREDDDAAHGIHPYTLAKYNLSVMRRWATRADLYRVEPKEHKGQKISGFIRRFEGNFDLSDIQLWARKNRGRGEYQILIYDHKGILRRRKDFECEGRIILADEVDGEDDALATKQKQAGVVAAQGEDRATALERQLTEERFERQRVEDRARTDAMFKELAAAIKEAAKPEPPKQSFTEMIAAVAPMVMGFLANQQATATANAAAAQAQAAAMATAAREQAAATAKAAADQMTLVTGLQDKAEARMAKVLEATAAKRETMADTLRLMADLKKAIGGDSDPMKIVRDTVPAILKTHMDMIAKIELHKAGVGTDKEETIAERVVSGLTDLVEQALPMVLQRPTTQPVAPFGAPSTTPAPAALPAPAAPQAPRGGGAIVTPEQQAAHEAAEKAAADARRAAAPVVGGAPPVAAAAPAPAATAAPVLPAALVSLLQDVNGVVFDRALAYMAEGRVGSELAHDCMTEEEAHAKEKPGGPALFFTKRFVAYLGATNAERAVQFIVPVLALHPPAAPLTDEMGKAFLVDFCRYFSEPAEEPDGEGA